MKPQFKLEEIYLDLSKLSEEQQRKVTCVTGTTIEWIKYAGYLIYHKGWKTSNKSWLKDQNLTELTYSQFLDMMGETIGEKPKDISFDTWVNMFVGQKQVNPEKERINNDGTLYIGEGLENYYKDQLERTGKFKVVSIDATSEEVLQVENNGWVKIESEKDLPKEVDQYWFASHNNKIEIRFYNPNWIDDRVQFRRRYTHYQPIVKPLPPKF